VTDTDDFDHRLRQVEQGLASIVERLTKLMDVETALHRAGQNLEAATKDLSALATKNRDLTVAIETMCQALRESAEIWRQSDPTRRVSGMADVKQEVSAWREQSAKEMRDLRAVMKGIERRQAEEIQRAEAWRNRGWKFFRR